MMTTVMQAILLLLPATVNAFVAIPQAAQQLPLSLSFTERPTLALSPQLNEQQQQFQQRNGRRSQLVAFFSPSSSASSSSVDQSGTPDNSSSNDNHHHHFYVDQDEWAIDEDWSARSQSLDRPMRTQDIFHQDVVARAAFYLQQQSKEELLQRNLSPEQQEETAWMERILNEIHPTTTTTTIEEDHEAESVTASKDSTHNQYYQDEAVMEDEIAQLIRCNHDPTQFLIDQGRVVPPLTENQLHHVQQLVVPFQTKKKGSTTAKTTTCTEVMAQATPFFQKAVETIFDQHATIKTIQGSTAAASAEQTDATMATIKVMDAKSVAKWLQQSLSIPSSRCGPHDPRVKHMISQYGKYGQGHLELENFQALYLQAVLGPASHKPLSKLNNAANSNAKENSEEEEFYHWLRLTRSYEIDQVWSDLEMHDIEPPAYTEWRAKVVALQNELALNTNDGVVDNYVGEASLFHDECELVDDNHRVKESSSHNDKSLDDSWKRDATTGVWTNMEKSSHEHIDVCLTSSDQDSSDKMAAVAFSTSQHKKNLQEQENKEKKVPVRFQDGDFVYIDEESCIGCMQCAVTAPSSFRMIPSSGRARTFVQDTSPAVDAAVASCPVNCMHYVGFDRLVELERARDHDEFPSTTSTNSDSSGTAVAPQRQLHKHFGTRYQQGRNSSSNKNNSNGEQPTANAATQWISHTPMYVSRMESSDANHKESIYHYIRNQCYKSSACPQKGCYDCPMYKSHPETNPHLARKRAEANHVRAQHFIRTGAAQAFRNAVEL